MKVMSGMKKEQKGKQKVGFILKTTSLINYFFKIHKNKVEDDESINRFDLLVDSTGTEEKVEEEI